MEQSPSPSGGAGRRGAVSVESQVRHGMVPQHFAFVDALRGLACLWVVLNHLKIPELARVMPAVIHEPLVARGGMGVLVFFVLSGFVISHSLLPVALDRSALGNFLVRRAVRLSPPYYVSLVVAVVVTAVSARVKHEQLTAPGVGSWVAHLLYLPHLLGVDMINGVHWTLYLEMQFYVAFGLVLWWMQRSERSRPGWWQERATVLAATALVWPVAGWSLVPRPEFVAYWFAFVSGVLLCWRVAALVGPSLWWAFHVLLVAAWVVHRESMVATVVLSAVVVLAATRADRMTRWLRWRPVQFLGVISYSLYLIHAPVIGVVDWLRSQMLGEGPLAEAVAAIAAIVVSIVAAWALWWAVEQPSIRWSRSLRAGRLSMVSAGEAAVVRRRSG
jgi:peptidoglycan/LPS O-acetylase OafA/YrhL